MISFFAGAIALATVFLYGCVGEIITEKAGHLNLGIPGIMCVGTAGGCLGVSLYMNSLADANSASWFLLVLISVALAFVFAALLGGVYGFLTVTLRCNQNITGLAVTIFGTGFTQFIMDTYVDRTHFEIAGKLISKGFSFANKLGWFGEIFLSHGVLVYLSIIVAAVSAVVLKKTRLGLHLRAVGESPATADAAGINVTAYKYGAILVGSGVAGIGGLFYIMDCIKGSWENASTIESLGWLSIALVIFTLWKPHLSIIGSILFAALYTFASATNIFDSESVYSVILNMLPYVITVVVLIITSIIDSKENQPPASLGLSYFREER